MNVIVIPDNSSIVIPLIEKNGHTYLLHSNFSDMIMWIIKLIENTNYFLKNLNKNSHCLDLTVSEDKYLIFDVKRFWIT